MTTKEGNIKRYCCLYASDFHLEMIILPYIKSRIDKSKIVICTEINLEESINILLRKMNFSEYEKNNILSLCWNKKEFIFEENKFDEINLIIIGNKKYIEKIKDKVSFEKFQFLNIVECYDMNSKDIKSLNFSEDFEAIINTSFVSE